VTYFFNDLARPVPAWLVGKSEALHTGLSTRKAVNCLNSESR